MIAQQLGRQGQFTTSMDLASAQEGRGSSIFSRKATIKSTRTSAIDVEQYYTQFGPMVLRRCRNLLGNEEAAADAMQDTFVKLMRYRDRLNDEAPGSLLYRMATNVCLNKIRASARNKEFSNSELLQQIACARVPEDRFIAANLINRLFEKHQISTRAIAVMYLLDGMTLQEVADEVGMSVSGVRKRLRPLRAQLKEL